MRTRSTRSDSITLENDIVAFITEQPRTSPEIQHALKAARLTVGRRLYALEMAGAVHAIKNPKQTSSRTPRLWLIGPSPDAPKDPGTPKRVFTTTGPPCPPRDPLVAALFGPAQSAPRCVACCASEGDPHDVGCPFARYV